MKKTLTAISIIILAAISTFAQPNTNIRPDETVLLYADSFEGNIDPVYGKTISYAKFVMAEDNELTGPEKVPANGNIGNINKLARIDLYFPKKPNGQMIVVCPGGGYSIVSSYNEGVYVADWMLEQGITVCIVKYRLPNGHCKVPHADVENAFRYCRAHAAEWGVKQIGVMGFSAGGHFVSTLITKFETQEQKPDFAVLVYPVISMKYNNADTGVSLLGDRLETEAEKWSNANFVRKDMPQTMIIMCSDDKAVPIQQVKDFYNAAIEKGADLQLHFYPKGGHGFWMRDRFKYRSQLYPMVINWIKSIK